MYYQLFRYLQMVSDLWLMQEKNCFNHEFSLFFFFFWLMNRHLNLNELIWIILPEFGKRLVLGTGGQYCIINMKCGIARETLQWSSDSCWSGEEKGKVVSVLACRFCVLSAGKINLKKSVCARRKHTKEVPKKTVIDLKEN